MNVVDVMAMVLSYCSQAPFLCTETVGPASEGSGRVLTVCVPANGRGTAVERHRRGRHWVVLVDCDAARKG